MTIEKKILSPDPVMLRHYKYSVVTDREKSMHGGLHKAVIKGDIKEVKALIRGGIDPNRSYGLLPLSRAVALNKREIAELLLDNGARVNGIWYHEPPLFFALDQHHLSMLELLVQYGADVNKTKDDMKFTPLHWTAMLSNQERDNVAVARYLLDNFAGVNLRDHNGWTPLMRAAANGNASLVELLLAEDADPGIRDLFGGKSAADIAMEAIHVKGIDKVTRILNEFDQCTPSLVLRSP